MGAFKKLKIEAEEKKQVRVFQALKDFELVLQSCGCDDISDMCSRCESAYVEWVACLNEECEEDIQMLNK